MSFYRKSERNLRELRPKWRGLLTLDRYRRKTRCSESFPVLHTCCRHEQASKDIHAFLQKLDHHLWNFSFQKVYNEIDSWFYRNFGSEFKLFVVFIRSNHAVKNAI